MSNTDIIAAWRTGKPGHANPAGDVEAELEQMFAAERYAQQHATSSVTKVCSGHVSCCA